MPTITNTILRPLCHSLSSFLAGLLVLVILYLIVRVVMSWLRKKGAIFEDFEKERKSIGLSTRIAAIEQFLFFLAAIAGKEVFGWAVGGWLVFKGIHQWARWHSPHSAPVAERAEQSPDHYHDAIDRNRFMVFLIGTGMSIAAGGISGAVYHYVMYLLQKYQ